MTEPVAYMWKTAGGNVLGFQEYKENTPYPGYATPLYTAEHLHPRVKMTQAEFDEWKFLYEDTVELSLTAYRVLNEILNSTHNISGKYVELSKRVYLENNVMLVSKKQAELTNLFINYSPDNPEETIEIVPDMKWFVVRKLPNTGGNMLKCSEDGLLMYNAVKEAATQFDTKEEAEKWTNPLTEAAQLTVEVE